MEHESGRQMAGIWQKDGRSLGEWHAMIVSWGIENRQSAGLSSGRPFLHGKDGESGCGLLGASRLPAPSCNRINAAIARGDASKDRSSFVRG
ncbi:MAG: hypothetical protein K0R28_2685 [Paenibacillus sp.]|nr:hypothetical protein [Paenibacillus sp.]